MKNVYNREQKILRSKPLQLLALPLLFSAFFLPFDSKSTDGQKSLEPQVHAPQKLGVSSQKEREKRWGKKELIKKWDNVKAQISSLSIKKLSIATVVILSVFCLFIIRSRSNTLEKQEKPAVPPSRSPSLSSIKSNCSTEVASSDDDDLPDLPRPDKKSAQNPPLQLPDGAQLSDDEIVRGVQAVSFQRILSREDIQRAKDEMLNSSSDQKLFTEVADSEISVDQVVSPPFETSFLEEIYALPVSGQSRGSADEDFVEEIESETSLFASCCSTPTPTPKPTLAKGTPDFSFPADPSCGEPVGKFPKEEIEERLASMQELFFSAILKIETDVEKKIGRCPILYQIEEQVLTPLQETAYSSSTIEGEGKFLEKLKALAESEIPNGWDDHWSEVSPIIEAIVEGLECIIHTRILLMEKEGLDETSKEAVNTYLTTIEAVKKEAVDLSEEIEEKAPEKRSSFGRSKRALSEIIQGGSMLALEVLKSRSPMSADGSFSDLESADSSATPDRRSLPRFNSSPSTLLSFFSSGSDRSSTATLLSPLSGEHPPEEGTLLSGERSSGSVVQDAPEPGASSSVDPLEGVTVEGALLPGERPLGSVVQDSPEPGASSSVDPLEKVTVEGTLLPGEKPSGSVVQDPSEPGAKKETRASDLSSPSSGKKKKKKSPSKKKSKKKKTPQKV